MPVQKAKETASGNLPNLPREPAVSNETTIRQTFVPPDTSLAPGQAVLYFDPTNGAGKLMVKAKTLNGTVVSGSVNLV